MNTLVVEYFLIASSAESGSGTGNVRVQLIQERKARRMRHHRKPRRMRHQIKSAPTTSGNSAATSAGSGSRWHTRRIHPLTGSGLNRSTNSDPLACGSILSDSRMLLRSGTWYIMLNNSREALKPEVLSRCSSILRVTGWSHTLCNESTHSGCKAFRKRHERGGNGQN